MRRIEKNEPTNYTQFLKHNNVRDWDKDIPADMKREVREYILRQEQHNYSAYTEKRLSPDEKGVHVDHFYKQSHRPDLRFEWSNLFVDKHTVFYGADYKDSKKSPVRTASYYDRLIDPQAEDPHHFFRYMTNGDIASRADICEFDKAKANFTIDAFNLKHTSLSYERKNLIGQIANLKCCGYPAFQIKEWLMPNSSFPSLIEYFCDEVFDAL